jgi:hypothetical protein
MLDVSPCAAPLQSQTSLQVVPKKFLFFVLASFSEIGGHQTRSKHNVYCQKAELHKNRQAVALRVT